MKSTTATRATTPSLPRLRPLLEYLDGLGHAADLRTLERLLSELDLTRDDLAPVRRFDRASYQRNLVRKTEWYELVCLCWLSGQRTPIHNHAGSSCAFLVVDGVATETRFERTASGLILPAWTKHHEPGYICASHEADIHQVANTQPEGEDLITLHIYSPKLRGYNVFRLDTPCAWTEGTIRTDGE